MIVMDVHDLLFLGTILPVTFIQEVNVVLSSDVFHDIGGYKVVVDKISFVTFCCPFMTFPTEVFIYIDEVPEV